MTSDKSDCHWEKTTVVKGAKVPMSIISQHAMPVFTDYEEPNLAQPSMTPQRRQTRQGNVISTWKKKAEDQEAVRVVAPCESAGPAKRLMYYKDKVHQGTIKFSFEEFRAIRWKKKQRVREEAESFNRRKVELVGMELSEQLKAMPKQMAELERIEGGSNILMHGNPGDILSRHSSSSKTSTEQGGGNPFTVYSDENSRSDRSTLQQSVGSKDMAGMKQLWFESVREEDRDSQPLTQASNSVPFMIFTNSAVTTPPQASFQISTDSADSVPSPASLTLPKYTDTAAPAPFPIFFDNSAPKNTLKQRLPSPRSRAAQYNKLSVSVEEDVVGGNSPPAGYNQPPIAANKSFSKQPSEGKIQYQIGIKDTQIPENQDVPLGRNLVAHDELLKCCREKTSRYFLEAKCGVGATSSREYMLRPVQPKACVLCDSKEYVCLGSGCMGSVGLQHLHKEMSSRQLKLVNPEKKIPGKVFKARKDIDLIARNPGRANAIVSNILCRKRTVVRKKVEKHSSVTEKPVKTEKPEKLPRKSTLAPKVYWLVFSY